MRSGSSGHSMAFLDRPGRRLVGKPAGSRRHSATATTVSTRAPSLRHGSPASGPIAIRERMDAAPSIAIDIQVMTGISFRVATLVQQDQPMGARSALDPCHSGRGSRAGDDCEIHASDAPIDPVRQSAGIPIPEDLGHGRIFR